MNYLAATEYQDYGLEATTPDAVVGAASALIDAHCRRPGLDVRQYEERIRVAAQRNTVRLTYLPLATVAPATSPIVSATGRYCTPRRGEWPIEDLRIEVALMFGLADAWTSINTSQIDYFADTGELTLPVNILGLWFTELDVTYTAGFATIPDPVKYACAQIVRNLQATPALNVKAGHLDRLHLNYFSDTLIDQTVISLLAPYVAQKVG